MDIIDFRDLWVRPALQHLAEGVADERLKMAVKSLAAERLMLGTAVTESALRYLRQRPEGGGFGPALSFFQIEPKTFADVMRYVKRPDKSGFRGVLYELVPAPEPIFYQLATYPLLAVCVARLKYWMRREALPPADDIRALAIYHKVWYNTAEGKARIADFIDNLNKIVLPAEKQ